MPLLRDNVSCIDEAHWNLLAPMHNPFDLSKNEVNELKNNSTPDATMSTIVKLDKVLCCESPSLREKMDFSRFFRTRSGSSGFIDYDVKVERQTSQLTASESLELSQSSGSQEGEEEERFGELYTEAAEAAMEEMVGKLATKYYALAEEAWALIEE